jgi:hypothetical protein
LNLNKFKIKQFLSLKKDRKNRLACGTHKNQKNRTEKSRTERHMENMNNRKIDEKPLARADETRLIYLRSQAELVNSHTREEHRKRPTWPFRAQRLHSTSFFLGYIVAGVAFFI